MDTSKRYAPEVRQWAVRMVFNYEADSPSQWAAIDAIAPKSAILEWADWFNHRRLLEPIGNMPPADRKAQY